MKHVYFHTNGNVKEGYLDCVDMVELHQLLRPFSTCKVIYHHPLAFLIFENHQVNRALRRHGLAQTITGDVACVHMDGDDFDLDDVLAQGPIEVYSETNIVCPNENEPMIAAKRATLRMPFKCPKRKKHVFKVESEDEQDWE